MEEPIKIIAYVRGGMCIDVVTNLPEDSWEYSVVDYDNEPDLPDNHVPFSVLARVSVGREVSGIDYANAMRFREAWRVTVARALEQELGVVLLAYHET